MNLIERAGKRLGLASNKSVVEKAADRLSEPTSEQVARPHPVSPESPATLWTGDPLRKPTESRRQTQRQLTLDLDRLRAMGYTTPGDQSTLAEEFRLIKRPLLDNCFARGAARSGNANLIMVTSSGPSEGKTFVAINLAMSMASEHDVHVLLIDADVVNPSVPGVLGFEAQLGMIDVVRDPSLDLADVMIRTDIDNLTILPAGQFTPLANELLASPRMTSFVDEIARRYSDRVIIFDSPPVLARTEPTVLARHVGQIAFVVEAERTSRSSVSDALRLIDDNKSVRIILNKVPSVLARDGFGQYYNYGYYRSRARSDGK
jgi:receptor protein-tyrosine kinase